MSRRTFFNRHILFFTFAALVIIAFSFQSRVHSDTTGIPLESNPHNIAINPITDIAVVSNEKADSVSVVDLNTQTVLATIPVGKSPKGIAIDRGLNLATVSNNKDNTVSVIDLNTLSVIKTIPVGKEPEGISINQTTHKALIANHKDNTVSVIDLITLAATAAISVGKEPIDTAIDSTLNLALVINQKDNNAMAIDLNTNQIISIIPVGQKPRAIDINPETRIAAVANEKDNTITTIDLKTWQTHNIPVGKHPTDIAINQLNNRALVICDEDRSLLLIDRDTKTTIKNYSLNKLPKGVAVNNYTNIAAVVDDKTDSLTLIQLPNPIPETTSINPDNAQRESNGIVITIEGNRFIKTSTASLKLLTSDLSLLTSFIDNHHIQAVIPAEMLTQAGIFQITVTNPAPEGGTSNSIAFTVNNPVPTITALDPAEATAGTQSQTANIYGTGFFDNTLIYFGNIEKSATSINKTKLQIDLTSDDLETPGKHEITAYNLPPGGGHSNKIIFTIKPNLEISIASPSDGAAINKAKTIVRGTFKSSNQDVGITVNGILAEIKGNEWIANNVPLTAGSNTITATIKDSSNNSANASITINTIDTTQPVELSANIISGISPLTIYFSISTEMPNPITSYMMDFEGDGVIDYTGSTFEDISHTYTSEGIFYPTVTITDDQGNTYSDTIAVTVLNKTEIDALLKGKWEGMKEALKNKDIAQALNYHLDEAKQLYSDIYIAFFDQLPLHAQEMQDIQLIYVKNNTAKYRLRENELYGGVMETITYYIYFVIDKDGLWKIYRY